MDQCHVGSVAPGDLNRDRTRDPDGPTVVADAIPRFTGFVVEPVLPRCYRRQFALRLFMQHWQGTRVDRPCVPIEADLITLGELQIAKPALTTASALCNRLGTLCLAAGQRPPHERCGCQQR